MEEFTIYMGALPSGRIKIGVDCKYPRRIRQQKLTDHQVLEVHDDVYEVSDREQELQRQYGLKVDTNPYHVQYFINRNIEKRNKVSLALTGKVLSEETKAKISTAHAGKVLSEETRSKISETLAGRELSEEHKANISACKMGNTACLGNVLSQEHRDKISKSNIGHPVSQETRDKISKSRTGLRYTISNTENYGRPGVPLTRYPCEICGEMLPASHMKRHLNRKNPCQPK